MKILILSTVAGLALAQGAVAANLISGAWYNSDTEVSFTQTGQAVEGTCNYSNNFISGYGFVNGSKCMYGTFDGTTFTGKILYRYPIEYKTLCPSQWESWQDAKFTVSSDGNTLAVSHNSNMIYPNCSETNNGLVDFTYAHKAVSSTNICTATFNASTGRLIIPCLAIPVTNTQTSNYSVEMQQRTGGFVFDVDFNKVQQR